MKPLLCWDTWCWLAKAEELAVIKKRPALLRAMSSGKYFLRVSTGVVFQTWPRLYLVLAAELGSERVTQMVLVLKA